ncbi:hypothetical protein DFH28DRAFT_869876, partial [Melampsora americana]
MRGRLKKQIGLNVAKEEIPSGDPCFGLKMQDIITQELSNPFVSSHLVLIPEAVNNEPINRLSQSKKWREDYSRDLQVPMIEHNSFHYYIYKPLQILSGERVVPIHFYQQNGVIFSKCFKL